MQKPVDNGVMTRGKDDFQPPFGRRYPPNPPLAFSLVFGLRRTLGKPVVEEKTKFLPMTVGKGQGQGQRPVVAGGNNQAENGQCRLMAAAFAAGLAAAEPAMTIVDEEALMETGFLFEAQHNHGVAIDQGGHGPAHHGQGDDTSFADFRQTLVEGGGVKPRLQPRRNGYGNKERNGVGGQIVHGLIFELLGRCQDGSTIFLENDRKIGDGKESLGAHWLSSATRASQNIKVSAEAKVETEMAATEKSASPPISLAMT